MSSAEPSAADEMNDLIRAVLKLSAHAERAGLAINKGTGLTNARWLIIDQVVLADAPLTVSEHARRLGLSRQAVQRVTDEMVREGLARLEDNPADRRARVLVATEAGRAVQGDALARARTFNEHVAAGFTIGELRRAVDLLTRVTDSLRRRMQA